MPNEQSARWQSANRAPAFQLLCTDRGCTSVIRDNGRSPFDPTATVIFESNPDIQGKGGGSIFQPLIVFPVIFAVIAVIIIAVAEILPDLIQDHAHDVG